MEVLLSAVVSDLVGRLFSVLIEKYQERAATDDTAVRLQRLLLRARVVVEEAEGRQITNLVMLQQLNQMRQKLCRATYALDTFRGRAIKLDGMGQGTVSRSGSDTRPQQPRSNCAGVLSDIVKSLEGVLNDMREFVVLLGCCPHVTKQPYSAYLFMEKCMFGRQMEKEEIICFLLRPSQDLDVLPIIGPQEVGKRTLVEHVCLGERVRECFSKIHRLRSNDLDDFQADWSFFDPTAKSLTVINMVDSDTHAEVSWRRFYSSAARRHRNRGSKIIVISRMEAHSALGTMPALMLRAPRREELWYFFRALAFGAADPDERPDLVHIAMELCEGISDFSPFVVSNIIAASLRADINVCSWHGVRKMSAKARVLQLDASVSGFDENTAGHYYPCWPLRDPGGPCMFSNRRKLIDVERSELPKVTMSKLIAGVSLSPARGKRFDMLVWQSRIPPYASYVTTCDMERSQQLLTCEKRARKRRRDQHDNHQQRCV